MKYGDRTEILSAFIFCMIFKLTSLLLKVRDRSKCESAETCSPGNINNFLGAGHEQSKTAKVLASGLETFEVSEIIL